MNRAVLQSERQIDQHQPGDPGDQTCLPDPDRDIKVAYLQKQRGNRPQLHQSD